MKKNKIVIILFLLLGAGTHIKASEKNEPIKIVKIFDGPIRKVSQYMIKEKGIKHILNLTGTKKFDRMKEPFPCYYNEETKEIVKSSYEIKKVLSGMVDWSKPAGFNEEEVAAIVSCLKEEDKWENLLP